MKTVYIAFLHIGVCIQYSLRVSIPVVVHWSDSVATSGPRKLVSMLKEFIMRIILKERRAPI